MSAARAGVAQPGEEEAAMADVPRMRRTCMFRSLRRSVTRPPCRCRGVGPWLCVPGFPRVCPCRWGEFGHSPELQSRYRHTRPGTSLSWRFSSVVPPGQDGRGGSAASQRPLCGVRRASWHPAVRYGAGDTGCPPVTALLETLVAHPHRLDDPGGRAGGSGPAPVAASPRRRSPMESRLSPADTEAPSLTEPPRVLIVDDHKVLTATLASSLWLEGFEDVNVAGDLTITGVLDAAEKCRAEVVLLDLHLGGAGRSVAMIPLLVDRGMQVLIMTAEQSPHLLAECLEAGAAGIFDKVQPFDHLAHLLLDAAMGRTVLEDDARRTLLKALRDHRLEEHERQRPFARLTTKEGQ